MGQGELLIRRARPDDAAAFTAMMTDEAVFGGLLQMPYPALSTWQQRLGAVEGDDLILVAERDGQLLGHVGMHTPSKSPRRSHARSLGISVVKEFQGQGVGSALMAAVLDYADNWANVRRIELTVYTENHVARRLYEKFGFQLEGTLRDYAFRNGEFTDTYSIARLRPS